MRKIRNSVGISYTDKKPNVDWKGERSNYRQTEATKRNLLDESGNVPGVEYVNQFFIMLETVSTYKRKLKTIKRVWAVLSVKYTKHKVMMIRILRVLC